MRVVTIVSLGASAVLGLGALLVAKLALPNVSAKAAIAPTQGSPLVVASRPIKYGEKLEPAMLTVIKVPAEARPEGSYTAVAQVLAADHGGAPVALFPIAPREALLPAKLSGPGARPSVAAEITEGMRAYTIKVTDTTGVGGHALPGDRVDVVLLRDTTPQGPVRTYVSYVVLQNVRVLGIDLNADLATEKPASPNNATLEVSVADAQKLSMASNLGTLSLALRRTGQADVAQAPPVRTADFLAGGVGGPVAVRAIYHGDSARPAFHGILIIEGEAAKRGHTSKTPAPPAPPPSLQGVAGAASTAPATAGVNAIG